VPVSPALISLGDSPRLSFFPAVPGGISNLRLAFTPQVPLNPGDLIMLRLPGFSAPDANCFSTFSSTPSDASSSAGWNASTNELSIRITNYILAFEPVTVTVPMDAQISLPVLGILRNEPALQISAKSEGGALDYSRISVKPSTLHPTPYTLHPQPYTLHPQPSTLKPEP